MRAEERRCRERKREDEQRRGEKKKVGKKRELLPPTILASEPENLLQHHLDAAAPHRHKGRPRSGTGSSADTD